MCGIVGVISGERIDPQDVVAMRDTLAARGPDDSGLSAHEGVVLGHRRLGVIDPGVRGAQPMTTGDGRFTIVYNGELYNDAALREELAALGVEFVTRCDTETVLASVAVWGLGAKDRLRGMYAFAVHDARDGVVLLARDPMGVKPLYTAGVDGGETLVFGSEVRAVLAHPRVEARPDLVTLDAYACSIRPEFGGRTLFEGVSSHPIGEWSVVRVSDRSVVARELVSVDAIGETHHAGGETRGVIEGSVRSHLRSDVPMCALLSGGLDSAIITTVAKRELGSLHTFCAGADEEGFNDDFAHARNLAAALQTDHTEVVLGGDAFVRRWVEMVNERGVPLSTPNEVAIDRVTHAMRERGFVVTLSGEGADELFGGYAQPMLSAHAFVEGSAGSDARAGVFHVHANAWIGAQQRGAVLSEDVLGESGDGSALAGWYQAVFEEIRSGTGDALEAHRRFHERVNLPNLLRRLDLVSMAHSIEGRVPFADAAVSTHAAGLAMSSKFVPGDPALTKVCLREAFGDVLPRSIIDRPKASFPVPFQRWCGALAPLLRESSFARSCFTAAAVETVAAEPEQLWNFAWPMLNLTLWGERWWGDPTLAVRVLEQHPVAA